MRSAGRLLLVLALAFLAASAIAQTQQMDNVLFRGELNDSDAGGYDEQTVIICRGIPACTGEYKAHVRQAGCSNYNDTTGRIAFTGLDLTRSGALQGTVSTTSIDTVRGANGVCTPTGQVLNETGTYTGTWNLATQRGSLRLVFGPNDTVDVSFTADLLATAPVFPMSVRATIGPQTSTVIADIQFRSQDVGRNGSIFAFASIPLNRAAGAMATDVVHLGMGKAQGKADPVPCVLAQVNSAGQLVAVSLAQLEAFTIGAFAAAGTSVTILNNTPTPNVAGATFYVGYGTSASTMLSEGVFRNAVLVPGTATCPPLPYMTSLWWNPSESGWGLNINQQGSIVFATLFTYDSARAPLWLVMSGGALQANGTTFTGDLYRTTGPAFNANPFTPIGASNVTRVGSMTIAFTEANAATLTYTNDGTEVVKQIQRQVFGSRSANCLPTAESRATSANYQDLWWIPSESGWGINITHQDQTLFATLFTYDSTGRGLWLVLPGGVKQADGSYFGDLFRTAGPAFNAVPFTPIGGADITNVGTMRLRFTDGNNGTLTYTYQGATVTKSISRQVFSTPQFACN